jgi:hypothetical protein
MEMPESEETPAELRRRAQHYRDLRRIVTDRRMLDALTALANEYEATAERLEQANSHREQDISGLPC